MIKHMLSTPISKDNAVSPVIGTILIIALTIVLVSISAVVFLGFDMAEPAPILGISIGQQGNIITVTHLNGAELPAGTYKILVDGVDKTAEFGGTVDFGPGITLSWDSGTEAVETVSVVYTGTNGGETVLAQKNIGKAGSGEVVDHQILPAAGQRYLISDTAWGGEWEDVVEEAKNNISGTTVVKGKVYYDMGEYWFVRDNYTLTYLVAQTNPRMAQSKVYPNYEALILIKTNRVLTSNETLPVMFKESEKPVTTGTLFYYNSKLYVWGQNFDATTFDGVLNTWAWYQIGTLYSP